MKDDWDVIVAGAGPAGLLLATKIAPRHKVLIFDQRAIGQTQKFWLTNTLRLRRHNLEHCILYRANSASVGSFLGGYAVAAGDFAVVDEYRLLRSLADRCAYSGVTVVEGARLRAVRWRGGRVYAETSCGTWSSRILVDATGGASPIASTFRLHRLRGFFTVYGAHLRNIELLTDKIVGSHVLRLGHPTPMFEVFPTGRNSALAVVFYASAHLIQFEQMRSAFLDHVADNPFFVCPEAYAEGEGKMGGIPIGQLRRRTLPGIVSFGESQLIQSPLMGAAFNEVLEYADSAGDAISAALIRTRDPISIRLPYTKSKRVNDWVQHILVHELVGGTLESYERLVRFLESLGPECCYRLFCSSLTMVDIPRVLLAATTARLRSFRAMAAGS